MAEFVQNKMPYGTSRSMAQESCTDRQTDKQTDRYKHQANIGMLYRFTRGCIKFSFKRLIINHYLSCSDLLYLALLVSDFFEINLIPGVNQFTIR